jgi:OOP family OmpA-OmpF porin
MVDARSLGVLVLAAFASAGAWAQGKGMSLPDGKTYLGLSVGRSYFDANCDNTPSLTCNRTDRTARLSLGRSIDPNWSVEASYVDLGTMARLGGETRAQGVDLSMVGRAKLASTVGVFGKLGTTYGRTDTSVMGAPGASAAPFAGNEQGFGLSFGGGVSYDITKRLSATLEVDSHDFRFAGGGHEAVRSTNLGLQFKY